MNKRIAIPIENGVLCGHFGHCQEFAIMQIDNNEIAGINNVTPPEHAPGAYPKWLANYGVTDVIVGGIGQKAIMHFDQQNIRVHTVAQVKSPQELTKDLISGTLELNMNSCNHDHHRHSHNHAQGHCRH